MDAQALDAILGSTPGERAESWHFSRNAVRALAQQNFVSVDPSLTPSADVVRALDLPLTRGRRIVFVNGVYSALHSDDAQLGKTPGLRVRHDSANRIELIVSAPVTQPLHLVYLSIPGEVPGFWAARCVIRLQDGAQLDLVEQHLGTTGAEIFGRVDSDFTIAAQARMRVSCLSDLADNVSLLRALHCNVGAHAAFETTQAHCGGRLQRIESMIDLAAQHARLRERGVFALRGRQHVDVHLDVRHRARDTSSDVDWRGVADQRARGILHGAIVVAQGADGTDAKLQTKNLLLSAHAEIDAQPILEIYADEVKAAHGATVGQLDERALFYLRSRGIKMTSARAMLIDAFCREIYAHITDEGLRGLFAALLSRHLLLSTQVAS